MKIKSVCRRLENEIQIDVMTFKTVIHQSMQEFFGACSGSHHLDILKFTQISSKEYRILLRCPNEALSFLLQTIPAIYQVKESRCHISMAQASPLLSMLR